jgi:alkanesulfonate monooxygenase SsuD/methylene tetrahydromethanopterin reductase-like flavin-dependent oxidoreductase (luciferase family)
VPLGVLDLVPIASGSNAAQAISDTGAMVRSAEAFGYTRYWFAEHHLNPGVACTSPAVLIALVGGATRTIRLGSGGVQSGHRTALSIVEEFGLLDAVYPDRIDLGVGRSGGRNFLRERLAKQAEERPSEGGQPGTSRRRLEASYTANGVLIPAQPSLRAMARSPRIALTSELLQQSQAESPDYGELLGDVLAMLRGTYRLDGVDPSPTPGAGAKPEVWVLGSSAGESAEVAGRLGLRFAASYHITPSTALDAVAAYRKAFVASCELDKPYVAVSADVVVGRDDESARELAQGYGLWVLSIRRGEGAIPFPSPAEALRHDWSGEDRELVRDRIDTQFVGSAATVAGELGRLQEATDADELIVTTITHRHEDRLRSLELLAGEWFGRQAVGAAGKRAELQS